MTVQRKRAVLPHFPLKHSKKMPNKRKEKEQAVFQNGKN